MLVIGLLGCRAAEPPPGVCPAGGGEAWALAVDSAIERGDGEALRALVSSEGVLVDGAPPRRVDLVAQLEPLWARGDQLEYTRSELAVRPLADGFAVRSTVALVQRPSGRISRATEVQVFGPGGPCGQQLVATRWQAP